MQRFSPSRDDRSERVETVRSKYPEKSLSDNRTKPIWEDSSETALYRGSGRLFKPRPGPTSLICLPLRGLIECALAELGAHGADQVDGQLSMKS
jgi:hypothetical protein